MSIANYTRNVGSGKTFLSPTDLFVNCDTSNGLVEIVLPKISTLFDYYSKLGGFVYSGLRIIDKSKNAGNNNIIVEAMDNDFVGGLKKVQITKNGGGGIVNVMGENDWFFWFNTSDVVESLNFKVVDNLQEQVVEVEPINPPK